jgi:predicted helicase
MSAIRSLIDKIRTVATSTSDLGSRFEELIRQYFLHDPLYIEQFSDVWLWNDWKERGKEPDTGVDLVAKNRDDDGYTAIQCKCYAEDATIQRSDIDSFLVRSAKKPFTRRILVATVGLSRHAENVLEGLSPEVQRIGIHHLEDSAIDWSNYDINNPKVTLKPKKKLRPHQEEALTDVRKGFKTADRGKLIMACGTGKTFTSLKIAEEHAGKNGLVLFLVPSLSLLDQTLRE